MKRLTDWLIVFVIIGLLVYAYRARADDCHDWAVVVAELEQVIAREGTPQPWMTERGGDGNTLEYRALNWLVAGGTAEQAWHECGSY